MNYQDGKWKVEIDEEGIRIYVKCECGDIHDLHLTPDGKFNGRGTSFQGRWGKNYRGQHTVKVAK